MPKYEVQVELIGGSAVYEVEAENEDEAIRKIFEGKGERKELFTRFGEVLSITKLEESI